MYLSPGYHSGVNVAGRTTVRTVVSNGRTESHKHEPFALNGRARKGHR